jgi:hypothetical protein
MGLTKERGPDPGDLSPTNSDGFQVWAVGFYNDAGALRLGEIFADPCDPAIPSPLTFPEGTASVKFLFTDASPVEVAYLAGGPKYDAMIDPEGSGSASRPVADRQRREVRLLQLDIAVKDSRAAATGWVFGTFAWIGPTTGDMLFDNLTPVSLQWGNDPGVFDREVSESWINPDLEGVMYGWEKRPFLGFNGRANGPADNWRSSCLSCHAAARVPRSSKGLLGFSFDMEDLGDSAAVREHVDIWFQNLESGALFDPGEPAVASLDYSLQLDAATFRMCRACNSPFMNGPTPRLCIDSGFFTLPTCSGGAITTMRVDLPFRAESEAALPPPPRQ